MIERDVMFQVPIWHLTVDNWEFKKNQLLELLSEDNLDKSNEEFVPNDYSAQGGSADFKSQYSDRVSSILFDDISQFFNRAEFSGHMYASWFERAGRSEYHVPHNHGMKGFSAVCFVDYDSEVHTPTQFISPFPNFVTNDVIIYDLPDVIESSLIFFPSCITHYTHPNNSDIPRTILSFNLDVAHL